MSSRTEIIEAGAEAVCLALGHRDGGSECEIDHAVAEAALAAMLPLIKAQLAAELDANALPVPETWRDL